MGLTRNQMLAISIAVLGVLMASTAQLTDLVGPQLTKIIVSTASLINSVLASVLAIITGQTGTVRDVQNMPGIERITVNAQASGTLASMAVDPEQSKIMPAPGAGAAVQAAANR